MGGGKTLDGRLECKGNLVESIGILEAKVDPCEHAAGSVEMVLTEAFDSIDRRSI
jgi:hypothetical protein